VSRHITVRSGERLIVSSTFPTLRTTNDPQILGNEITIHVDEQLVAQIEIPKPILEIEPEAIGSQVRGVSRWISQPTIFTKIAHGRWVYEYHDRGVGLKTNTAKWTDIAVFEVINPKPEKPKLEEPTGYGAVIETDCDGCNATNLFLRLESARGSYYWQCGQCRYEMTWDDLLDGRTIEIRSRGF